MADHSDVVQPLCLHCAGSWTGEVSVESDLATVRTLRDKIVQAASANCNDPVLDIKLIVAGRNLQDLDKSLKDCGVTATSCILVLKHADSQQKRQMDAAAERDRRIKRLKHAVDAMAARGERRSQYSLQLENQDGAAVKIDPEQQSLLIMGMTLHASGKKLLGQGDWAGALNDLELAEESFDLCRSDLLQSVDNIGLLLLDSVWCLFKLQDSAKLAAATAKLQRARACLAASHGAGLERLRVLHGDFQPELATYVRLELLEGLAAFYGSGDAAAARERLLSAQAKWARLAVSDDSLAALLAMGFTASEANRALRFCSGDVGAAAAFVLRQRQQAAERKAADRRKRAIRKEVEALGRTPIGGKAIDAEALQQLEALGFGRAVAAEALRVEENSQEAAINALLDGERNAALQVAAVASASRADALKSAERQLRGMGYAKHYVREALKHCRPGDVATAVGILSGWAAQTPGVRDTDAAPADQGTAAVGATASAVASAQLSAEFDAGGAAAAATGVNPAAAAAATQLAAALTSGAVSAPPVSAPPRDDADHEMEAEVASLMGQDSLSGYDVDVSEEGAVIKDFLARLEQAASS